MKKNEYVAPEMEIVEIVEKCGILAGSDLDNDRGTGNPGDDF